MSSSCLKLTAASQRFLAITSLAVAVLSPLYLPTEAVSRPDILGDIGTGMFFREEDLKELKVKFPLKSGRQFYMVFDSTIVPRGALFVVIPPGKTLARVSNVDELSSVVDMLTTSGEALAFVRFFTDMPTCFLLEKPPFYGLEVPSRAVHLSRVAKSYLRPPSVTQQDGRWVIERDLALYPPQQGQLIRSHEVVTSDGVYSFSVKEIYVKSGERGVGLPFYD